MTPILRSPILARLEDDAEAYTHAIISATCPRPDQQVYQAATEQAIAALMASLACLRASIAKRPGVGLDTNAEVRRLAQAAIAVLEEREGAPEAFLALMGRLL